MIREICLNLQKLYTKFLEKKTRKTKTFNYGDNKIFLGREVEYPKTTGNNNTYLSDLGGYTEFFNDTGNYNIRRLIKK